MRILKSLLIWVIFIPVAILNGFLREYVFEYIMSEKAALALSGISLSGFIYLITWTLLPHIGKINRKQLHIICVLWFILTFIFETVLCLTKSMSLNEIIASYNPLTGNLFLLVLFVTGISPFLITKKTGNRI